MTPERKGKPKGFRPGSKKGSTQAYLVDKFKAALAEDGTVWINYHKERFRLQVLENGLDELEDILNGPAIIKYETHHGASFRAFVKTRVGYVLKSLYWDGSDRPRSNGKQVPHDWVKAVVLEAH